MMPANRFSEQVDNALFEHQSLVLDFSEYSYRFENFYHPLVGKLITQLNQATGDPIAALLDPTFLNGLSTAFFTDEYTLSTSNQVGITSFPKAIDLDHWMAYANYNWELLYHLPVAIAVHLTQNRRFAEAQKWFHYVFDPASADPASVSAPARYWKCLYFRNNPVTGNLADLLTLLSTPDTSLTQSEPQTKQDVITSYKASCAHPFEPFAVARSRPWAFQYYVVMKYLDNLIAWGDSLFSQMTIETVNEATLCYAQAANLLGPRPQPVPAVGTAKAKTYNDLKNQQGGLDPMGNALVDLEGQFPFNIITPATSADGAGGPLFGMGRTLYFCIPANAKLLGYWDTVEDRLRKIRNCENIQGQVQLMPLFDPPIDPGMLIAAAAAGLDLGNVVSGLNQPAGPVRSLLLIQKALELAAEVRALGSALLAAIEKGEAEHLARLRQTHETVLQAMMQNVRYLQWQQAQAATESLLRTRATTLERYKYYLRLLGTAPDPAAVPDSFTVDHSIELTEDNFQDTYQALVAQYDRPITMQAYPQLQLAQAGSPGAQAGASGTGQLYLNTSEDAELNQHMPAARDERFASSAADTLASVLTLIPDFHADLQFWGLGVHLKVAGGDKLAGVSKIAAEILRTMAGWEQDQGAMAYRKGVYQRRADEWLLQANTAAHELVQTGRQLLTSLIAEQAASHEYATAKAQSDQSQEVLTYLLEHKFAKEELYTWMSGELTGLYYQYYRLAVDTARRAEQTMKTELMRPEVNATTYIQPTYWDSGHQGLLSGEPLYLDVKRMELDYHAYNVRELELTRHVSIRQLDPLALLRLKVTGSCTVSIPEWLYDKDCPGHYMRRIKTVAVSVPSVTGPYTSVNCTLTLQHSTVRVSSQATGQYMRDPSSTDARFTDYFGSIQSIVTSGAVSDSGMFETNLRDERFLPFEGAGAISTWTLALPAIPNFDYSTITDVILHVRYTARDGGQDLAGQATDATKKLLAPAGNTPSCLLLSLRHDFPAEWYAFTSGATQEFTADLPKDYFPYTAQGATLSIVDTTLYADDGGALLQATRQVPATMANDLNGNAAKTTLSFAPDPQVLQPTAKDVFLVIGYSVSGL